MVKEVSAPEVGLDEYISNHTISYLEHFPRRVTESNFMEICDRMFLEIGITEKLDVSLMRIAEKLNFQYKHSLPRVNVTPRSGTVSAEARQLHYEKNELDYKVYNYVAARYGLDCVY